MKFFWLLIIVILLPFRKPFAREPLPMRQSADQQGRLPPKTDTLLSQQFSNTGPGGVVLVGKEGKIIYQQAFGKADLEKDVAMQPEHVFRIGSITKQFTACAILKLAEEGRLSLQDDIRKFIPDYPTQGHSITIEHLLTHTSGISTGAGQWTLETRKKDLTPPELIGQFKQAPMEFTPGSSFRYNNNGYVLLGYIITLVTGTSYQEYITTHFFQPLGMTHTCFDSAGSIIPNRASGYEAVDNKYRNAAYLSMSQPYAAGAILSTAADLYTWNKALIAHKVILPESLKKAWTGYRLKNGQSTGYGYGWWLGNIQGSPDIRHDGLINGFSTFTVYLPEEKVFVAFLTNGENNNPELAGSRIAAIAIGKAFPQKEIPLSAEQGQTWEGVYGSAATGEQYIVYENDHLVMYAKGGGKTRLRPFAPDQCWQENTLNILTFTRDNNGNRNALVLKGTGDSVVMPRTNKPVQHLTAIPMEPANLEKYVGKYRFSSGFILTITREDNRMYGQGAGARQVKQEIVLYAPHQFFARNMDAQLSFHVDENGTVRGLTKIQNGEEDAEKVE
jgi:CubicO group peptidase (beta-lactamase class C family)